jgi:hypothetical protein
MSPVEILKNCIAEKEQELLQLKQALKILQPIMPAEPSVAPPIAPLQSEVAEETAQPAPTPPPRKEVYTGPRCGACQNKMYQSYRTMPSGAMVSLWKCNDSACGNEVYQ